MTHIVISKAFGFSVKQAGITCMASSQADLTQNLVLKTHMLNSRDICDKTAVNRVS